MERYNAFFNESINLIEKKLSLGCSYEDRESEIVEAKFKEWEFILDLIAPGKFVAIGTGNYFDDEHDEYYDNYHNHVYLIEKDVWTASIRMVVDNERKIYDEYATPLPDWMIELYDSVSPQQSSETKSGNVVLVEIDHAVDNNMKTS